MEDRTGYSMIGFRSENSIAELKKYKNGEKVKRLQIDDARKIVQSFYKLISERGIYNLADENGRLYLKLLTGDMLGGKRVISSVQTVNSTRITLEKIANDNKGIKEEDVKNAIDFFEEISKLCREEISKGTCH